MPHRATHCDKCHRRQPLAHEGRYCSYGDCRAILEQPGIYGKVKNALIPTEADREAFAKFLADQQADRSHLQ